MLEEIELGRWFGRPARALRGAAGLGILVVLLEVVRRTGMVSAESVPPAMAVLARTAQLLVTPAFLWHVGGTLTAWAVGLAVAVIVAVPAGVALGSFRRTRLAATTAVEFLRPIPSVALIPLVILLLGRGLDMRIVLVAYAATWPILLNTITGVRAVDPVALDTARAYGLGPVAVLWRVSLPSAAPFTFTGVRIAAGIGLIVTISAELIAGGGPGIGAWMLGVLQPGTARELLYAGIVVSGLLGLTINAVLVAGEHQLFAWHQRVRA